MNFKTILPILGSALLFPSCARATVASELDAHPAATVAGAGDAVMVKTAKVDHVWVVFKTHLDIGYTDTIEKVLKKYRGHMMDGALEGGGGVAQSAAGAALLLDAGRLAADACARSAAGAGAQGTHRAGGARGRDHLSRASLHHAHGDAGSRGPGARAGLLHAARPTRYGRPLPIGAKMTDVPSHSWVMPTLLANAGVKFLQLGCNGTSAFMRVPRLFWWEGPDGSRILCNYTPDYGSGSRPPRDWPSKHYLAMEMTGDNHGPPTAAEVERLRQQAAKDSAGRASPFRHARRFRQSGDRRESRTCRSSAPTCRTPGFTAGFRCRWRPRRPASSAPSNRRSTRSTRNCAPGAWPPAPLAPALAEAYEQSGLFSEHTFGPWGPKGGSVGKRHRASLPLRRAPGRRAHARGAYKKYEAAFDDKRAFAHKADEIVRRELSAAARSAGQVRQGRAASASWSTTGCRGSGPGVVRRSQASRAADSSPSECRPTAIGPIPADQLEQTTAARPQSLPPMSLETPFFKVAFDLKRGGIASLVDKTDRS